MYRSDDLQHPLLLLFSTTTFIMTQRAVITGGTGLLGRQVVAAFAAAGWEAVGTGFHRASPPRVLKVDIQIAEEVDKLLDEVKYV